MAACVRALILTSSAVISVVSGFLSPPSNVTLSSRNMNLVLSWVPPDRAPEGLQYTTEYRSSVSDYKPACENITELKCELSHFSISNYGTYSARVHALQGDMRSPWAGSNHITPDRHTIIGSPNVSLLSNRLTLEVIIKEPKFILSTLRSVFHSATYNITYWKTGQESEPRHIDRIHQNRVVLDNLEPWSEYCVQVCIDTNRNPNLSEPSSVICESTTNKNSPWVPPVIVFVVMVVLVVLVVLLVLKWRYISGLWPKEALPENIKETLLAPPESSMFLAMKNSEPVEEVNHQVTVVAAVRTVDNL